MRVRRLDALLALALLGAGIAAYLTWVALDTGAEVFCTGVGDCERVQSSQYAEVAGIPVAALGLGMYLALVVLLVVRRAPLGPGVASMLGMWTFALALAGTGYSAYLTYLEFFVIEAICEWCLASAAVVAAIAALSAPDARRALAR